MECLGLSGTDDATLEALERLARDFTAAEAERVAALGCAEHLGRLLCERREEVDTEASRHRSGCGVDVVEVASAKMNRPSPEDKENSSEVHPRGKETNLTRNSVKQSSNVDTSKSTASGEHSITSDTWSSDTDSEKAQLTVLARRLGALRAECAERRDHSAKLDSSLSESRQALERHSAAVLELRDRIGQLKDVLGQRRQLHRRATVKQPEVPLAMLQARSTLHRRSCELAQIDARTSEFQAHDVAESQAWFREKEKWKENDRRAEASAAAEHEGLRAELTELSIMREALRREEAHSSSLLQLDREHDAQLLRLQASSNASSSSEAILGAWRSELEAQRAVIQAHSLEHAAIRSSWAEEAAQERAYMESRVELSQKELTQTRSNVLRRQAEAASELQLCNHLNGRLRQRERAIKGLKQEQCRWEAQRRSLGELEKHLQVLTSRLSHSRPERCRSSSTSDRLCQRSSRSESSEDASGHICMEEAKKILITAISRLSSGHERSHNVDLKSWNHDSAQSSDLECVAGDAEQVALMLRQEAAAMLPLISESFELAGTAVTLHKDSPLRDMLRKSLDASSRLVHVSSPPVTSIPRPAALASQSAAAGAGNDMREKSRGSTTHLSVEELASPKAPTAVEPHLIPPTTLSCKPLTPSPAISPSRLDCSQSVSGSSGQNDQSGVKDLSGILEFVQTPPRLAPALSDEGASKTGIKPTRRSLSVPNIAGAPYPRSLAGSPECQEKPSASALVPWAPDDETCITTFLAARSHSMSTLPNSSPSVSVPVHPSCPRWKLEVTASDIPQHLPPDKASLLCVSAGSPGEHVRRARNRLRDLRQGLERATNNPWIVPRLN